MQREADLVAQVYTLDGEPELIFIHVEVERKAETRFRRECMIIIGCFAFALGLQFIR